MPADFMREDWLEKLVHTGFDPDKPTFFLWEAVTMYLDREAVISTLRKIADTASGSVGAFDYFRADLIEARSLFWRYARAVTDAIGEPFSFAIESTKPSSEYLAAFLTSCGLSMEEQRNFGRRLTANRLWEALPPQSCPAVNRRARPGGLVPKSLSNGSRDSSSSQN